MKYLGFLIFVAFTMLLLATVILGDLSPASVHATVQGTDTPVPSQEHLYRPYPAPTGYPAFRRYYQIRCYPGCHYGTSPTPVSTGKAPSVNAAEPARERAYRSYPAPTGAPGFRRYCQIRCYPGCHSYPSATPAPTRFHP